MQAHGHDHALLTPSQQHPTEVRAGPRRALIEGALRPVQANGGDLPPSETGDRKRGHQCGRRDGQAPLPPPVDTDVARRDHKTALLEQKAVPWDAEEPRITEPARHRARQRCRQMHGAGHGEAEEVGGLPALPPKYARGGNQAHPARVEPTKRRRCRLRNRSGVAVIGVGGQTASRPGLDTAGHDQRCDQRGGGQHTEQLPATGRPELHRLSTPRRRGPGADGGRPRHERPPACAPARCRRSTGGIRPQARVAGAPGTCPHTATAHCRPSPAPPRRP
jgi:hypothetical protein